MCRNLSGPSLWVGCAIVGLVLPLMNLSCATAADTPPSESTIEGWINDLDKADPLVREDAIEALGKAKAKSALPRLEKLLDDPEPAIRRRAAIALWRIDGRAKPALSALIEILKDAKQPGRLDALRTLTEIDVSGEFVGPLAIRLLSENDLRMRNSAKHVLQIGGPKTVSAILEALSGAPPAIQRELIEILKRHRSRSPGVEVALEKLLPKSADPIRLAIFDAMLELGFAIRTDHVKMLLAIAKNSDAPAQTEALTIGLRVRPVAKDLAPIYQLGLKDPSSLIRIRSVESLWQLDRNSLKGHMPMVAEALKRPGDAGTFMGITQSLERIAPEAQDLAPAIIGLADTPGPRQTTEKSMLLRLLRKCGDPGLKYLAAQLGSPNVNIAQSAATALGESGAAALPYLKAVMSDKSNATARRAAFLAIAFMRDDAAKFKSQLMEALSDSDLAVRGNAAAALARISSDPAKVVARFLEILRDPQQSLPARMSIADSLRWMGPRAKGAVPELRNLAKTDPTYLRTIATLALWRIEGDTAENRADLIRCMTAGENIGAAVPNPLLEPLIRAGVGKAELIAALQEGAKQSSEARRSVLRTVGWYFPTSKEVLPFLNESLQDANESVRLEAAIAMTRFGKDGSAALPILINWAKAKAGPRKRLVGASVLDAIARLGPDAKEALPILLEHWKGPYRDAHRVSLAAAIVAVDRKRGDEQFRWLTDTLKANSSEETQLEAVVVLDRIDPKNPDLVPVLKRLIESPTQFISSRAMESLAELSCAGLTISSVRKQLGSSDPYVRLLAAEWLWKFDRHVGELVPVLGKLAEVRLASGRVDEVHRIYVGPYTIAARAASLLGAIGLDAAGALPELRRCADERDEELRRNATDAIRQITAGK